MLHGVPLAGLLESVEYDPSTSKPEYLSDSQMERGLLSNNFTERDYRGCKEGGGGGTPKNTCIYKTSMPNDGNYIKW